MAMKNIALKCPKFRMKSHGKVEQISTISLLLKLESEDGHRIRKREHSWSVVFPNIRKAEIKVLNGAILLLGLVESLTQLILPSSTGLCEHMA